MLQRSLRLLILQRGAPSMMLRSSAPKLVLRRSSQHLAPLGPFLRVVAQVVMVAGGSIGRAVRDAYKEAAKEGVQNETLKSAIGGRRMGVDEAFKILELDPNTVSAEEAAKRVVTMAEMNQIDAKGIGSPYLQSKIAIAGGVVKEELRRRRKKDSAGSNKAEP